MTIFESNLFYFGEHDEQCHLVYKKDNNIKHTVFDKSFINKVFDVYHLKQELRKLKMLLSIQNKVSREQIIKILTSHQFTRWELHRDLTEKETIRNELIKQLINEIENLYN